jgi:uncharacterized protein YjbI with pentapeptide repeats
MDESFDGSDLRSGKAFQSEWVNCTFGNVKAGLLDIRASRLIDCRFTESSLYASVFSASYLRNTTFDKCDFEQAAFAGVIFDNVIFKDCRLAYSSFTGGIVKRAIRLIDSNLHGADLDFAEIPDNSLLVTGCNLWGAKTTFGCQFWNGDFDQDTVDRFIALAARACPDKAKADALKQMAGKHFAVVDRLMRAGEGENEQPAR